MCRSIPSYFSLISLRPIKQVVHHDVAEDKILISCTPASDWASWTLATRAWEKCSHSKCSHFFFKRIRASHTEINKVDYTRMHLDKMFLNNGALPVAQALIVHTLTIAPTN